MPPDVVYVKLDAATRHAWIVPEGMVVWAMARAQHPGRTDSWRREDARRMIALCRSMIDADLAGESPSPSARDSRRDPQGRLLVDSHGFDRLLDGGLAGPAAALLPPAVAQAMTARLCSLSRTPLRRLVVTLAVDLERGDGGNNDGDRNNNNNRDGGLARSGTGGDDDDEIQRRDAVAAFVRSRCVRGTESCSADTLYRAFVAWAATGAPGQRTIHRSDFWRAIALHAAHAFDVGGGAHIVSGLVLSHRDQSSRSRTPIASPRRSTTDAVAAHPPPPHAQHRSPLGNRRPLDGATKGQRGERQGHAPDDCDDGDDTEDDETEPAERRYLAAGALHGDGKRTERVDGPSTSAPRACRVRYDVDGYLAAIDLLHDATGMWGAPTAKTVAGRIMYALRQRGWNFQKRRIGPGRATPLLRAVDVDAFLTAAARAAGAGDTALSIAHYAETDAYLQLMACLGQPRDPLGRRAAAVHARDCIAACAVIESTAEPPPSSPLTPALRPPPGCAVDTNAAVQPAATAGMPPIDSLTRRRLRQQSPTAIPPPLLSPSFAQAPSPSPSSPVRVVPTALSAKRSPTVSSPARRVRRRIVPSSSDDDDDDNNGDSDDRAGHDDNQDDDKHGHQDCESGADAKDHMQRHQRRVVPMHAGPMDDEVVDQQHRDADPTHGVGRPLDGPRAHPGNVCCEDGANTLARTVCASWTPATKKDALAQEAHYNGMLVDEMASCATPDLALCVWNRRADLWRLVLAVRPGSDRQRPWRIIADHRAPPASASSPSPFAAASSSLSADVRWMEWSRVRSLAIDLLTTSPHTVLAVDADCEPPGDGPDARAVTVASSWLFVVCRAWASGQWPSSDVAVPALALRMAEVAAADPGGPHAPEAIAVAQACVSRLRGGRASSVAST
nr:hypothetical protein [Pandoravirus belohorizontensis]